ARREGHEHEAPHRQSDPLARHVDPVFPVGARFAIRHVGLPALHPREDDADLRRHGLFRGDQDRSAEEFAGPLRRDLNSLYLAAWRDQAESLARWIPEPLVSSPKTLLMSVSIVIPVWNGRDLLLRLLASL